MLLRRGTELRGGPATRSVRGARSRDFARRLPHFTARPHEPARAQRRTCNACCGTWLFKYRADCTRVRHSARDVPLQRVTRVRTHWLRLRLAHVPWYLGLSVRQNAGPLPCAEGRGTPAKQRARHLSTAAHRTANADARSAKLQRDQAWRTRSTRSRVRGLVSHGCLECRPFRTLQLGEEEV